MCQRLLVSQHSVKFIVEQPIGQRVGGHGYVWAVSHDGVGQQTPSASRAVPATPSMAVPKARVSLPHRARKPRRERRPWTMLTVLSAS